MIKASDQMGSRLRVDSGALGCQKPGSTGPSQKKAAAPNAFDKLLANSLQGKDANNDFPQLTLPLSRNHAQHLCDIIQIRINNVLIRELTGSDENDRKEALGFDLTKSCFLEEQLESYASKFQQATLETTKKSSSADINAIIVQASRRYDVDPDLITAVVKAESDFNVNCTSPKGAMGLMQLMPETAKDLGVTDSYDAVENIMAGTRYLKSLIDRYDGNITLALAAYNWGMGNLEKYPEQLPRETQNYIVRINNFYQQQKSIDPDQAAEKNAAPSAFRT